MGQRTSYSLGTPAVLAFTGTSAQSAALSDLTRTSKARAGTFRIVASADCFIAIGVNPTATTSSIYLPAGLVEYIDVPAGSKIAAIQSSGAGNLNITPVTELD